MFDKRIFPDNWQIWVVALCSVLHQRSAWRLAVIFAGISLAKSRRTITSWFRAAGIQKRYKASYYFIGSIGRKTEIVATVLFEIMISLIHSKDDRVLMAIDDSPTKRYGPFVQGAGIHRNPTTTPDGAKPVVSLSNPFIYGHLWVTISAVVRHKLWATIGLPLLALLLMEVSLRPDFSNQRYEWVPLLSLVCEKMRRCMTCLNRLRNESVDDHVNMAKGFTFAIRPPKNEDGFG